MRSALIKFRGIVHTDVKWLRGYSVCEHAKEQCVPYKLSEGKEVVCSVPRVDSTTQSQPERKCRITIQPRISTQRKERALGTAVKSAA